MAGVQEAGEFLPCMYPPRHRLDCCTRSDSLLTDICPPHQVGEWFRGGVYDTKYLSRQLPEVFDGWTALGDVFTAVTQGELEPMQTT